ncbi:hypothetical protein BGZ76_002479 [Entomortierella beljakovae]|nr:hypothetical protein BGZ76_002479 [Entomortierella beljakovae]
MSVNTTPAVYIPEIVEHILSYLVPCQLRFGPNRVCKLWRTVCQGAMVNTTVWEHSTIEKKESSIIHQLEVTDVLIYHYFSWSKGTPIIGEAISNLSPNALQRIKKMVISGHGYTKDFSLDFISPLKSLTVLHIHPFTDRIVPIDTIFSMFPHLQELAIQVGCPSQRSELYRENPDDPWPVSVKNLRSLRFESMIIDLSLLEDLLRMCPYLFELQLVATTGWLNADRYQESNIFVIISTLCPNIKSFHFSEDSRPFTPDNLQTLSKAFPKLSSWSIREDYLLHLPDPMDSSIAMSLIPFVKQLTTLDLTTPPHMQQVCFPSKRLHHILCEAPNLIHLKARNTRLSPSHLLCYGSKVVNLWTCHKLETLHVSIEDLGLPHEHSSSRAIFAYLIKCCPRLRDICLWQSNLRLDLYSGFCLLSELKNLEKLVIATSRGDTVKPADLDWLSTNTNTNTTSSAAVLQQPTFWERLMGRSSSTGYGHDDIESIKRRDLAENENWERAMEQWKSQKQTGMITQQELRVAIHNASRLDNVIGIIKRNQEERSLERYCWPHLEVLRIRSCDLYDHAMDSKLRPHIVFQEPEILK